MDHTQIGLVIFNIIVVCNGDNIIINGKTTVRVSTCYGETTALYNEFTID